MFISDHTFPLIVIVLSVISNAAHFACKIDQVRFYIELFKYKVLLTILKKILNRGFTLD